MKNFVRICIILCISFVLNREAVMGQSTPSPIAIENITPPTPEGAALGKYGNFPVGLFTGTPNVSIELYNLKTKHLELPISLNYSSNGLRVDEMPTKVGMSWTLIAGGAITRTVYDRPDDQYTRESFPYTDAQISSTTGSDLNIPNWLEGIDNPPNQPHDTQFDEYSFNFNGHTGKFIIDLNNNPVLIPYSNLKIELNPFRITTTDGLQYFFETTEGASYTGSGGCSRATSNPFNNVWYLSKIINLNDPSDFITISYVNGGYTYHPQINQTITYFDPTNVCGSLPINDLNNPCGCQTPCVYGGPGSPNLAVDNFCSNTEGVNVAYINEITSSLYGKVKFIYNTSYTTSATPIPIDRLLTGIQVYQNNDGTNLLKSFNFNYTFAKPSSAQGIQSTDNMSVVQPDINSYRPFLASIQELDNAGNIAKTHTLDYNDINHLTARLSSSQDYWGYYNGKANNNSFIPVTGPGPIPAIKIADRNPDYNYAVKGMLAKVTFPTGGNVQFVYEGNTSRPQPLQTPPPNYTVIANAQANNLTQSTTFYVLTTATVTIARSYYCSNCPNLCSPVSSSLVWGQVNSVLNGTAVTLSSYSFAEYNRRGECSFSQSETLTLQPGIYGLYVSGVANYQLSLTATPATGSNIYALSNVPTMASLGTDGGGVRVKQQITYEPATQTSVTTNYQYSGMVIPYTPQYLTNISYSSEVHQWADDGKSAYCITGVAPCAPLKTCNYLQYSSNTAINTSGRGGSPVYYTSVTESVGDNFVVGGTEHTYSWFADADLNHVRGNIIPNATTPSSTWKNGQELTRNVFKMVNGVKVYLSKVTNTYTDDSRINNSYHQFITKRSGLSETLAPSVPDNCTVTSVFNLRMNVFDVLSYSTTQQWRYLSSTQETDYDMNGNNPITKTTNYYYDNPTTAMLTRVETINSKGQPVKSLNKYPGDEATITNLTPSESTAISELKAQNNFSPVLETEKYVNGALQTRIHTGYKDWGNGILKPESIKAQTLASPIESRIQFIQYDASGNLQQQAKTGDASMSYLWDYKSTYPIAEVKNASQPDIAYTSFEADGKGNWAFTGTAAADATAVTGSNSYNLAQTNGTITKTGLTAATVYTVSYWSNTSTALSITGTVSGYPIAGRSVNGWYYHEHKVTGVTSLSISGTCKIDELRLYPANAQMTTYTYTPLVGMSSQCDINNRITYYIYDGLQRLSLVKDQDGNVVRKICYSYAGQTTACPN